jgi:hypothetical protein
MTNDATIGLMIWDGNSSGTLLNVIRLLSQGKKVVLYSKVGNRFHELKSLGHWNDFFSACPSELRAKVEQRALSECDGVQPRLRTGAEIVGRHP